MLLILFEKPDDKKQFTFVEVTKRNTVGSSLSLWISFSCSGDGKVCLFLVIKACWLLATGSSKITIDYAFGNTMRCACLY